MKLRFESSVFKYLEDFDICVFDRAFSAVRHQFDKYGIDINIKDNKEVIIVTDGWYDKSTCLISACFASDGLTTQVSMMSIQIWCFFVINRRWCYNY